MHKNTITGSKIISTCAMCGEKASLTSFVTDSTKKPRVLGWFYNCDNHTYTEFRDYIYKKLKWTKDEEKD